MTQKKESFDFLKMRDATLSFVSIPFLTADEYVNFLTQKMKTSVVKTSEPICRNKALPNLAKEMLPVFTLHPHGTMLYHDKGITLSQRVSSISNVAALYL